MPLIVLVPSDTRYINNILMIYLDTYVVTPIFSIGGTAHVILRSRRCTKGFLNYFSVIIDFLKVVFNGEIVKFLKKLWHFCN